MVASPLPSQIALQPPPQWSPQQLSAALTAAFPQPTPVNSWLYYQCGTRIETESGTVVGVTLPVAPLVPGQSSSNQQWDAMNSPAVPTGSQQGSPFPPLADVISQAQGGNQSQNPQQSNNLVSEVFVQQRVSPIIYVFLEGEAIRMGYQIPIPTILSVNGSSVVMCNRSDMGEGFWQRIVGQNIAPVYGAKWKLRFVLSGRFPTTSVPVPPNPGLA
jgi:hypothetical protein